MLNVLITSAGSTNGVNIIQALKGNHIVAVDCDEMSAGLYMSDVWFVVPRATDSRFIKVVKDIVEREKIDIIFPAHSDDIKSLLDSELSNKLVLSSREVYKITENKILCRAFLDNLEVLIPKQYPKEFPMIVKPIMGTGSKDTVKVNTQEELNFYLKKDMFYEEFIEGIEYTVDGVSDFDGKMICCLPRIRIEKRGGLATKCITEKNQELEDQVKKIVENMKLVGAWNVQCIKRNDKYYFIDINNRFPSGGMPLATASGMNMPLILIDILKGKKPNVELVYGKTMLRYWNSIIL